VAVAAAARSVANVSTDKVSKETSNLVPSTIKKWLANFLSSKRKLKVDEKTGSPFKPTKPELLAYSISIAVLAFSFSYVKVSSLAQILTVLPTILVTSILVGFAKTFVSVVYSRHKGVWTEHKLWYFGLATFILTTLLFRVPFSSPSRNVHHSAKMTKRIGAILSVIPILMSLAFGGFFFILLLSGFTIIGGTGLAMCLIDAFFDTFPIAPMNGKSIFSYKKILWLSLFAVTISLYVSWLFLL
jgi:hypothetical protein